MNQFKNNIKSISIVIPNYNNQHFIEKCIRSVLSQSYSGIKEIIVVDDASTDSSKVIIDSLASEDERIIPIYLKQNSKVSVARNTGLNRVTSEYVTFLDGDDYYYNPDKISNEMAMIEEVGDKEAIVYSYIVRASSDDSEISKMVIPDNRLLIGHIYKKLLLRTNTAYIMRDYVVRTDYLRDVGGYNDSRFFFEDFELILKLSRKSKFYCTKEFGTAYRISENGLSNRPYFDQLFTINEIINQEVRRLPFFERFSYSFLRLFIFNIKIMAYRIKKRMNLYN